ncbi:MAG: FkbM family methyltransferase [Pseudomonadota bacterium]
MFFRRRVPARSTQSASLKQARARGVPVQAVLDVGVQRATGSLIEVFPDVPHLLFEPVKAFYPDIRKNYSAIRHEIVEVALSDVDGVGHLQSAMIDGKEVSHAWLAKTGEEVKVARLDTIAPRYDFKGPYLLKIDVDGAEIPAKIIDGAAGVMDNVSIVVCEMVAARFMDLASRIERYGFGLWDIVECCYYDDVFYQCDAIFVRKDLVANTPALKPFDFRNFDPRKWRLNG